MSRSRIIALALVLVAAAAASLTLPRVRPVAFHGTDLGPDSPARDFTLEAADGAGGSIPAHLADYRGRAVLLFFGYTSCPDVCPMTMAKLRQGVEVLGARRADVQVLLITVDPEVDTPARLREYVRSFDPGFVGLGGDRAVLAEVARSLGAWAGDPPSATPAPAEEHEEHRGDGADVAARSAARMIPHTSHVFGIDRAGRFRILWAPELTAEEIAEDVRRLLRL